MNIDLREHVINRAASWLTTAAANRLELRAANDAVTLAGPVRVRIRVNARNTTNTPAGAQDTIVTPLFDYTLRIPSGHTWTYALEGLSETTNVLGANSGVFVVIEPVLGVDEPRPELGTAKDMCCDAGVRNRPDFGTFFPVGCEPCPPQLEPTLPPLEQRIDIPVAPGGCVRPRYFDGMYLTREDLEAEQRYHLVKNRLQNRAAGAGVVWGFDVGLQGTSVCVKPGFAWDCCGRDLVVTAPYLVDTEALLRDPAAASTLTQPGAHRMHLLLEYVECPDDPRPVHGDPCSIDVARCEMGRTRETVRLRLVPPRDFDGRGPIDKFLSAVKGLDWAAMPPPAPQPDVAIPFELGVTRQQIPPIKLVPSTVVEQTAERPDVPDMPFTFTIAPNAGSAFSGDTNVVRLKPGQPEETVATLDASGVLTWKAASVMFPPNFVGDLTYVIRWRIDGLAGDTQLTVHFMSLPSARVMRVVLAATKITKVSGPCEFEACAPERERLPRFPTDPPWIHPHPDRPDSAADRAVLELAWRYMSSFLYGTGPAPSEIDPKVQLALHDLCAAWSESLIYRGPVCEGSPHGVVIGCARVDAGAIIDVDPWGGRRWSLQYALLSHWATQLGMLPPDLLLTKLGGLACCVGDLPRVGPIGPHPVPPHHFPPHFPPHLLPRPDRVRALAASAVASTAPLLRPAAEDIATSLAENVTLAHLVDGSPPWLSRLAGAGVSTIGSLLGSSPEELHERVLHRENAAELNALIIRAEESVTTVSRAVGESITAAATARRITSRADLTGDARKAVEESIGRRLGESHLRLDTRAVGRAFRTPGGEPR